MTEEEIRSKLNLHPNVFPLEKGSWTCTGLRKIKFKKGKRLFLTIVTVKGELVITFEAKRIEDLMIRVKNTEGDLA